MRKLILGLIVGVLLVQFVLADARLQVIHNAADPAAQSVDIWVNDAKLLDDFEFRQATPFIDVPSGVGLTVGVAQSDSIEPSDILVEFAPLVLEEGKTYILVANGVIGDGFAPNPDGRDIAFNLFPTEAEETGTCSLVQFKGMHGSTDAPGVDIIARDVTTLIDNARYGDITGYLAVPPGFYILDITPEGDNEVIVASFLADLSGLDCGSAFVFASGFLSPASNDNGPAFGLFAALPDGTVVEFPVVSDEDPTPVIPEFTVLGAAVVLVGAGIFLFLKRK